MTKAMNTAETLLRMLDLFQQGQMSTERIALLRTRINAMSEQGIPPNNEDWTQLFDSVFMEANRTHEPAKLQKD